MFCSKCGKAVPDNANVCGNCGNRVKTTLDNQLDLTKTNVTFDRIVDNVKASWTGMGMTAKLLVALAAILVVSMLLWSDEIISISPKGFGSFSYELTGKALLNNNGFVSFLMYAAYLVSIGAVVYPLLTNTAVTKKLMLLSRVGVGFNLGAFLASLLFGMGEAADFLDGYGLSELLEYVKIGLTGTGWLLLACFVAVIVISVKVEKDI